MDTQIIRKKTGHLKELEFHIKDFSRLYLSPVITLSSPYQSRIKNMLCNCFKYTLHMITYTKYIECI